MLEHEPRWTRRHKRRRRRWANDLRGVAPLLAFTLCLAGSASAILAAERVRSAPPEPMADAPSGPGIDCGRDSAGRR